QHSERAAHRQVRKSPKSTHTSEERLPAAQGSARLVGSCKDQDPGEPMKDPFFTSKPGDPIRADVWNQVQSRLRQEIQDLIDAHSHTGDDQGSLLSGLAIRPDAVLGVQELNASSKLTVNHTNVADTLAQLSQSIATQIASHLHTGGAQGSKLTG